MITAYETLLEAKELGITVTANGDYLDIEAPAGVMTLELMRSFKEHKADILNRSHCQNLLSQVRKSSSCVVR